MYSENVGGISWVDLTVNNARGIKNFYKTVIGFKSESLAVDDYEDYVMKSPLDSDTKLVFAMQRESMMIFHRSGWFILMS